MGRELLSGAGDGNYKTNLIQTLKWTDLVPGRTILYTLLSSSRIPGDPGIHN